MSEEKHYTVLVVDDTEANVDILVESLGSEFDVVVALDGESALEAVEEDLPDLILLDIMMPGMDGYEVCERLKGEEKTRGIPIVFLTAMTEVQDEAWGLALGAVDYVTKPFSPELVKARVRNQLELKQHRDHLEDLVKARTRELHLANEKLELQVKELAGRDRLVRVQMQGPAPEDAYTEIMQVVGDVLDVSRLFLYRPDKTGQSLERVSVLDRVGDSEPSVMGQLLDNADKLAKSTFEQGNLLQGTGGLFATPIQFQAETLGVLCIAGAPESIAPEDVQKILWRLSQEAALVIRMAKIATDLDSEELDLEGFLNDLEEQE